ncbi:phage tail assembly protein [Caballeronia sp. LZ065]|uniref:phage tail assembly protein n=1 Tax=Caballeronia sp. LZ065 TaxID=3038571 RepID=UPI0028632C17|nr:phage tail assembly protein [Caballeronia sp. LZ065]MDR5784063.1 phage tail assembly protein [Caballeronia sp. LZ065]
MSDTKTIQLRKPLTYGKGEAATTVESITLREPTAGEYEKAESAAGVYGLQVALIALLSGVPVDVIDQMYTSQIDEAADFIGSFGKDAISSLNPSEDEYALALQSPVKLTADDSPLNVSALDLSEPTNQQKRKASKAGGTFASSIALISIVSKVPKNAVRALTARDFMAACAYFNGFQLRRTADSDD